MGRVLINFCFRGIPTLTFGTILFVTGNKNVENFTGAIGRNGVLFFRPDFPKGFSLKREEEGKGNGGLKGLPKALKGQEALPRDSACFRKEDVNFLIKTTIIRRGKGHSL